MVDKQATVEEIIGELRSGMTLGIGGWGSRRKPMAVVRAICRSDLQDLTLVTYGGPDVGLLCATGKVTKVVCGFVTLDSIALDPHWRAARQEGRVALEELDEGMLYLGLQAAAWRVPFLPTRAGLGSDVLSSNPSLKTVRSPYPPERSPGSSGGLPAGSSEGLSAGSPGVSSGGPPGEEAEELVAVPALHLDAAVVHANRADRAGNAQFLGPDPYFDDLFLGAAARRFVSAEKVVDEGDLVHEGPLAAVRVHRLLTDAVVAAPRGAHFTACDPDYLRDEAFQARYAASAGDPGAWAAFRARFVDVDDQAYLAALAALAEGDAVG